MENDPKMAILHVPPEKKARSAKKGRTAAAGVSPVTAFRLLLFVSHKTQVIRQAFFRDKSEGK
jgi:hypothetical protein